MKHTIISIALVIITVWNAQIGWAQGDLPVERIRLPEGFRIEVYASNLRTARGLSFASDGTLFVGSKSGEVYAVRPNGEALVVTRGLSMPVGVDVFEGDLYISSVSEIVKIDNILANLEGNPKPRVLIDTLPRDRHHGWKFIKVGPDGKLYVPVGAPCNVCKQEDERYAGILRMNLDGSGLELVAGGVRNTVGFDWHPDTKELWFTDNGRDLMGDDIPPDELNRAPRTGLHFGFPYLHGRGVRDPKFWDDRPAGLQFRLPEHEFPAHVAALGMRFYTADQFPQEYRGGIFVAEHGSWNRSQKIGYRVSFLRLQGNRVSEYRIFAEGWLEGQRAWGRPADVEIGPDGALYVADDSADAVYRISYRP
ncbi:MAG: sorbosone dehydrogenase family protein [Spirochaetaceae bacterium]|nr:MAG: sorbosone dehydrogenase family protein [Spirochaetaceae bacterium]